MKKLTIATAALLATTALSMPAFAADSTAKQIQMLQDQLRMMQQQLQALQSQTKESQAALEEEIAEREQKEKEANEALMEAGGTTIFQDGKKKVLPPKKPSVKESSSHKFSLTSADGAWSIAPTGRIHFDMGGYLSQKAEPGASIATPGRRLTGGVNVRRARVGFQGTAMKDFHWELILDAGGATDGAAGINAAKISYEGIKNWAFELGYMANYFIMEEASSSNDILFIERSTPSTLASGVGAGDPRSAVGFRHWDKDYWVGAYLTGSAPGDAHELTRRAFAAYGRVAYRPYINGNDSIHIGGGALTTLQVADTGPGTARQVRFRDRPELRVDPSRIIDTGNIGSLANPVRSVQVYNIETAATYGSWYYQGEWMFYNVNRLGLPKVNFNGGYVQVSYTFNGSRSYSTSKAAYGGVKPVEDFSPSNGTMGAVEIAARISTVDLSDRYSPSLTTAGQLPGFVNGGRQTSYTIGLNWYWNPYMLWKLNYIHTNYDKTNPATTVLGTGTPAGVKLDAIGVRWQVMY